jgi:hypothetical protein
MRPLADLRRAVHAAACLAIPCPPCFTTLAPYIWRASKAIGNRIRRDQEKRLADFTPEQAARARRACTLLARALRIEAAALADPGQRDCLLTLAEDLDPL